MRPDNNALLTVASETMQKSSSERMDIQNIFNLFVISLMIAVIVVSPFSSNKNPLTSFAILNSTTGEFYHFVKENRDSFSVMTRKLIYDSAGDTFCDMNILLIKNI